MGNLPQKQIEAIIKLPAPTKYSHFIKEAVGSDGNMDTIQGRSQRRRF